MIVPNADSSCRSADLVETVPPFAKWLAYRNPKWLSFLNERHLLGALSSFDAVYSFPHVSFSTLRRVQKRGRPVIVERINCFAGKARQILEPEYRQLGTAPQQPFHTWDVEPERRQIETADFHFSPSPEVEASLLEIGVPANKIISTSYGWSPARFPGISAPREPGAHPTVLFVGYLCVRKGVHLLLRAWERAGIRGRLLLCGGIEPALAPLVAKARERPGVDYRAHTPETGQIFREADIFAFPSLEEGGPLVTYEAMAHGLAVIASPMGAGAILRNEVDGLVIAAHETDAWVEALRRLAGSAEVRERFGAAARVRAAEFTWAKVARRRADAMLTKLGRTPGAQL